MKGKIEGREGGGKRKRVKEGEERGMGKGNISWKERAGGDRKG